MIFFIYTIEILKNNIIKYSDTEYFDVLFSCITFQGCTIPHNIGCFLHQEGQEEPNKCLTALLFIECSFNNTNTIREILEFATELAHLTSITTFWFTSCLFDTVQSMCLVRCLTEDRVNTGHVQIYCNTIYEAGNSKVEL